MGPRLVVELLQDSNVRFLASTIQHPDVVRRQAAVRAAALRARATELQNQDDAQGADTKEMQAQEDFKQRLLASQDEAGMGNPYANPALVLFGDDLARRQALPPRMQPQFASGTVYLGSTLDSLLCQLYFNPLLLRILTQLIAGAAGRRAHQPIMWDHLTRVQAERRARREHEADMFRCKIALLRESGLHDMADALEAERAQAAGEGPQEPA